ncbi:MAG TPA: MBL fold metallo-hydrolase [Fibrobacteria bacterium]|nr:MBL fold metallo-hydrolase [Fibrobacteria bacterium]
MTQSPRVVVMRMSHAWLVNYNYLVVDPITRSAVLVDPAWHEDIIENALAEAQARLCGILLTHSDPDHTHLARPLAARHACPIWMSKAEIQVSGFSDERLVGIDPVPWEVGAMRVEPISTPGHSAGSTCFQIGDNLFTGDTLFAEGCGLCPDPEAARTMFRSLERLKARLGPAMRIFPGHSYGKPVGQEFAQVLKYNIYLQFDDVEKFVAFRMRKVQDKSRFFAFS